MESAPIDLNPLRRALATLEEALRFWHREPVESPLKRHLRSSVIQSFEFVYELSMRSLRRVLAERAITPERIGELSFNDLLRAGADAGLIADPLRWRAWRDLRNATSHAYDESKAEDVAGRAETFAADSTALLAALEGDGGT